jgi:low temperature requirement protein LtrA
MPGETSRRFKRWLWRPPRPHGDVIAGRSVSFLELFYDLVYVAVIAEAAHHLAEHVSVQGFAEFALIFSMIWIAWVNGSLYVELHGRDDGRTRTLVFVQMGILALLAVFTADAAGSTGPVFALIYAAFLAFMTVQWGVVRRQDRPEFMVVTGRYQAGMAISIVALFASVFVPGDARLVIWAGFAVAWFVGIVFAGRAAIGLSPGLMPTESLVERFGLFTIIVLGEVIFGVVDGLLLAEHDPITILTGILSLIVGFGLWWIYFDVVGRRLPRTDGRSIATWMLSHFPVTLAIAAAGAALVSLIAHAHDSNTPEGTAWLLAGSVGLGLVSLVLIERALVDAERLARVYGPLTLALIAGATAALIVGSARPAPWLLAALLVAILSILWFFAVFRFLGVDAWGEPSGAEPSATR